MSKMKKYNKLIRDKMPEIMDSRGIKHKIRVARDVSEYWQKLKAKLVEEAKEFKNSGDLKELADILEVIDEICSFKNIDRQMIKREQKKKAKKNGRFKKRIILVEAEVK